MYVSPDSAWTDEDLEEWERISASHEYMLGYADGKSKAHFEVRSLAEGWPSGQMHAPDCGCELCKTVTAVLNGAAKLMEAVIREARK